MKIFTGLFIALIFVQNSFGSPLRFKAVKDIKSSDIETIGTFNTENFQQIRVGAKVSGKSEIKTIFIYGVIDGEKILLESFDASKQESIFIDAPANKIEIQAKGEGNYKIFIWGD